jgi:hypothetical protein
MAARSQVRSRSARQRRRRQVRTFVQCVRQFLTPEVFKQARQARGRKRRSPRWEVQPLLFVLLTMTWCTGDSTPERFETACAFYVACHASRKRPGKTHQGFQDALSKLPVGVLRGVAAAIRRQLLLQLGERLVTKGWRVFGCDGSRVECPRSVELEQRLGKAGKEGAAPTAWVTALVHLRSGLLWAWRVGKGTASEQLHLLKLLLTLPPNSLIVTDAAYQGYELAQEILAAGISLLVRVSSKTWLYTETDQPLEEFREGLVYYWPLERQRRREPPLELRLIRVRSPGCKHDVWLLTNVLSEKLLSAALAGQFYRWRWENEGLFRTYKRTLAKVKLTSRTVRLVHRELEGSLLAVQLMLAQAALKLHPCTSVWDEAVMASPRQVLREIRRDIRDATRSVRRPAFVQRLARATRERRPRTSAKATRDWPRRKPHQPPGPPQLHTLTNEQKALRDKILHAA